MVDKKIYAIDSFIGFDPNELKKEQKRGFTNATTKSFTYSSLDYVLKKIKKLEISEFVIPVKGFFQDTLPTINKEFSFGFLDCDLEDSLSFATENIWKKLSPGGMLFFDDYASNEYKGAKVAIDNFVINHQNEIKEHGFSGRLYHITKK